MNRLFLILRNLLYFRAANLAVMAGMAVATAVLTGALMVGDSVRGSLHDLAVQRLGPVDHALVTTRFFDASLADRLAGKVAGVEIAPAVVVRGGASDEDKTRKTAGVQIAAVGGDWVPVPRGQTVINDEVAGVLDAKAGKTVLLRLPVESDTPRDAALAKRERQDITSTIRAAVRRVDTGRGFVSMFGLEGSQRVPRNAWVNLRELQGKVDQEGRVNVLFADDTTPAGGDPESAAKLNAALKPLLTLEDYGLSRKPSADGQEIVLNSRSTFIERPVADAADQVAKDMGIRLRRVSVYLIDTATPVAGRGPAGGQGDKKIYYAVAAGIDDLGGTKLGPGEIALNEWAAKQIDASVGDRLRLSYYVRRPSGQLERITAAGEPLRIAKILPMRGLGADPTLTPAYKGLTDAEDFSDWEAPTGMHIDENLADEPYWDKHQAAPKLFVSLDTARKLWGGVYGDLTSLRVPAERAEEFFARLRDAIDPTAMGMTFRPIRAEQLEAAGGSTDFSILFVSFSFFLIVAAALLVAMLFRLNIEQRARQLGLLSAVGFAPAAVRRMALGEGMLLALAGGLVGLAGAIGYTWLMVAGLRTWWVDAVGTTAMRLHVEPLTLAIGLLASLAVAFLAILWAVWHLGRADAARLMAGGWQSPTPARQGGGRWARLIAIVCGVAGFAFVGLGAAGAMKPQTAFLGGGAALLVASLAALAARLRPHRQASAASVAAFSVSRLGVRNASRHTARSVLSIGLIAFAAFTLVTVASMREGPPDNTHERDSGAGGYGLIVQADIPLTYDPSTPAGRDLLGIQPADAPVWRGVGFMPMRKWRGEDISCLNLMRPGSPTILAVPHALVERKAFKFAGSVRDVDNAWTLLEEPIGDDGTVPVITDAETAQYILKLGLGDATVITDPSGNERKLKLVATLDHTIFQSELLMSEANFQRLFPTQSGYGTVLVETSPQNQAEVQRILATSLEENAAVVDTTAARLASYAQVKNTYLSTFQTLGSLGLMLGTIGLAVVLLRNLVERRSELALLTALGFRPSARLGLVLSENAFLLVLGLLVGCGCALIGVSPAIFTGRSINFVALGLTLGAVLAIGLAGLALAVWLGQRRILPADLRAE